MEIPKDPQAHVGAIVVSNRDSDRQTGRIKHIGVESGRPFVLWEDNEKAIASEWQHITAVNSDQVCNALGISVVELEKAIRAIASKAVTASEAIKRLRIIEAIGVEAGNNAQ
jgi:hypothetical protein